MRGNHLARLEAGHRLFFADSNPFLLPIVAPNKKSVRPQWPLSENALEVLGSRQPAMQVLKNAPYLRLKVQVLLHITLGGHQFTNSE